MSEIACSFQGLLLFAYNMVATDALIFKKELPLKKPIVCLQAFYRLKCFEQTDLYQSVLKMQQNKFLFSVRLVSCGGNSVQPDDDGQDLLSEQAHR